MPGCKLGNEFITMSHLHTVLLNNKIVIRGKHFSFSPMIYTSSLRKVNGDAKHWIALQQNSQQVLKNKSMPCPYIISDHRKTCSKARAETICKTTANICKCMFGKTNACPVVSLFDNLWLKNLQPQLMFEAYASLSKPVAAAHIVSIKSSMPLINCYLKLGLVQKGSKF